MKIKIILFLLLTLVFNFNIAAKRIDITSVGGKTDGKTSNTKLIGECINKLSRGGGGTLYFPAGKYLTGPIHLKSNITIELDNGATLLFSDKFEDYLPFVEMRYEGVMMKSFSPLLYADGQENICIKGNGTIDGQGKAWWTEFDRIVKNVKEGKNTILTTLQKLWIEQNKEAKLAEVTEPNFSPTLDRYFFRPPLFQALRCKNIKIEGVTIINSPFWTVNPEFCQNVTVDKITIINPQSPNTDGINPSSCKDVHISNCHISVGDDCITLKSGRDLQGRNIGIPCENITITNCTMLAGHGGVVIGSENSGSVRNIAISNCIFDGTDRGIRIKSRQGRGGFIENITVSNIVMRYILKEAITIDLEYAGVPKEPFSQRTPVVRDILINSVTGYNINVPLFIRGLEDSLIENIHFSNVNLKSQNEPSLFFYKNISFTNFYLNGKEFNIKSINK